MASFFLLLCVTLVLPRKPAAQRLRRSFVDTAEQQLQTEQNLLDAAKLKFNRVNNGYYEYQVQRSCFCDICDIQAMDVYVENNTATTVQYAEGNDYALNQFCVGNEEVFANRLQSSQLTIDDIFALLQTAISNQENVAVLYHDRIGIPLSISVNPSADIADDEWFMSVNCIQFADIEVPTTTSRRSRRSQRTQITTASFNSNDSYSCANVQVPAQCPAGFFSCHRYSDGCNTCSCDDAGNVVGCTKRVNCEAVVSSQVQCIDCESNTEWSNCGANEQCVPDCQSSDNFCGLSITTECSAARCQCPLSRPRWNGQECVTESECGITTPSPPTPPPQVTPQVTHVTQPPVPTTSSSSSSTSASTSTSVDFTIDVEPASPFCVSHCAKYSDGCVTCNCDKDGFQDADCLSDQALIAAAGGCFPGAFAHRTCPQCQDPERMTYTQCGRADITCDTLNAPQFTDITQCVEKCQCNDEYPIYDDVIGRCLSADFCAHNDVAPPLIDTGRCVEHCPVYFNGCNACQCPDILPNGVDQGADFCTNIKCEAGVEGGARRTCFRCELSMMEYTQCGKCDRTCLDPAPRCLNADACLEKCQCPLEAPIYHDGECITLEQCPLLNAGSIDNVNLRLDLNDLFSLSSNAAPATVRHNTDHELTSVQSVASATTIEWDEHTLYFVVAAICVVSGAMLLLWPWWTKRQRNLRQMLALQHDANDADDEQDSYDEYADGEDDYNVVNVAVTAERNDLAYAPDGSLVDMYN